MASATLPVPPPVPLPAPVIDNLAELLDRLGNVPLRIIILKASVSVVWVASPLDVRNIRFPLCRRPDLFSVAIQGPGKCQNRCVPHSQLES